MSNIVTVRHQRLVRRSLLGVAIATSCLGSASSAEVVTLLAAQDVTLYETADGSLANGAGAHFFVGRTNNGALRRSILSFDLASLAGSTITGVTLSLHYSQGQSAASEVSLFRATTSWGEGASDPDGNEGAGAPAGPGDASWTSRGVGGWDWATAGGDFDSAARATSLIGSDFGFYHWSSDFLVADVQAWVNGDLENFGWFLRGNETANGATKRFDSRQNSDGLLVPRLTIEYVVPAPGAAFIIMAVFASAAPRRRRRTS